MKIVLTGGGTGGHLMPLIAVARKIKEKNPSAEFVYVGPEGDLEKKIMGEEKIPIKSVAAGKMRRYFSPFNFLDFFKIPLGIVQALWHLLWLMPEAIFSKGGYASVPAVVAGWIYRIPILIHESDAIPGLSNSMLSKFCDRIAVTYPEAKKYFDENRTIVTGSPIRSDIAAGDPQRAIGKFGFLESKKNIFVWGGSQGAAVINKRFVEILPDLLRDCQVVHQTGEKNYEDVKRMVGELGIKIGRDGYQPLPFIGEELKDILAAADLVISRAGANSIAEIAANAKPAILIPIENSANNHQRMNAYSVAKSGGAVVLEENNLGGNIFVGKIREIINNPKLQVKLSEKIRAFHHPDAADKIAEGVLGLIK